MREKVSITFINNNYNKNNNNNNNDNNSDKNNNINNIIKRIRIRTIKITTKTPSFNIALWEDLETCSDR